MRFIFLGAIALSFVACGRPTEESLLNVTRDSDPLSFARTNSRVTAGENFQSLENLDFETSRRSVEFPKTEVRKVFVEDADIQAIAENKIRNAFAALDLRFEGIDRSPLFIYVGFSQFFKNIPIVNAKIKLRFRPDGEFVSFTSSLINDSLLKKVSAEPNSRDLSSYLPSGAEVLSQKSVVLPRREDSLKLHFAREFVLRSAKYLTAYQVWVDENSGEILSTIHPEYQFQIVGDIIPGKKGDTPVRRGFGGIRVTDGQTTVHSDENGFVDLSAFQGKDLKIQLANDFITVINAAGRDNQMHIRVDESTPQELVFDDKNSSPEERNIYYWINVERRFVEDTLGYKKIKAPIVSMAHDGIKLDNAYFNPLLNTLAFGDGDIYLENTAYFRDIILHELGHAVTQAIYGLKADYEFRAMNEAFSDYMAATISGDPKIGTGSLKVGVLKNPKTSIRELDNTMKFPADTPGKNFHKDGQVFSGALWNVRNKLGKEKADLMIHEARMAQASSIREFYLELRAIDEAQSDGDWRTPSPNAQTLWEAFLAHGLNSSAKLVEAGPEDLTLPWVP